MYLIHQYKTFLQTLVLLMVLFPISKEWLRAPQVQWRRDSRPFLQTYLPSFEVHFGALASTPKLIQGSTRLENSNLSLKTICVQLSQTTFQVLNKPLAVSQLVSPLLEACAASASSVSSSARSWLSTDKLDGSTATGSHGPGPSEDNRNTRRRLDSFSNPDDENARSAV